MMPYDFTIAFEWRVNDEDGVPKLSRDGFHAEHRILKDTLRDVTRLGGDEFDLLSYYVERAFDALTRHIVDAIESDPRGQPIDEAVWSFYWGESLLPAGIAIDTRWQIFDWSKWREVFEVDARYGFQHIKDALVRDLLNAIKRDELA